MSRGEEIVAAHRAGRMAQPGDRNPYEGRGVLARMWRLGYKQMLLDRVNRSPARQAYLENVDDDNN